MFDTVTEFEKQIAEFYNAPYAVATDCCTHAIELSLIHTGANNISVPSHTYISVPFTASKLNLDWRWRDEEWQDFYYIGNTNIIDAAVWWEQGSYIKDSLMCLSFQFKKHLSLGRGGAVLCSTQDEYTALKKLSYDGRLPNVPWVEQNISSIGYHYYMTPETAADGINKLSSARSNIPNKWCWTNYPYLPDMEVFNV
jgi:dTDP-4-amino-4,6-dideoxygalactose transaminase